MYKQEPPHQYLPTLNSKSNYPHPNSPPASKQQGKREAVKEPLTRWRRVSVIEPIQWFSIGRLPFRLALSTQIISLIRSN